MYIVAYSTKKVVLNPPPPVITPLYSTDIEKLKELIKTKSLEESMPGVSKSWVIQPDINLIKESMKSQAKIPEEKWYLESIKIKEPEPRISKQLPTELPTEQPPVKPTYDENVPEAPPSLPPSVTIAKSKSIPVIIPIVAVLGLGGAALAYYLTRKKR
jgi:hypothetical protein